MNERMCVTQYRQVIYAKEKMDYLGYIINK